LMAGSFQKPIKFLGVSAIIEVDLLAQGGILVGPIGVSLHWLPSR
jgi:hypothetical protein